jgi:hypothetical protein
VLESAAAKEVAAWRERTKIARPAPLPALPRPASVAARAARAAAV